ncbi:MAG: DUF3999 family protein [Thermoguttaceae bacterium]
MVRTLMCCWLLGFALQSFAAQPEMFRFSKPINRDQISKETILSVILDSDVYAATRSDFRDLRIFDNQGHETPYLIEKVTEPRMHTLRTLCGSTVKALHKHAEELDVLLRLDTDAPAADGLSIVTPLTDYERRVHVYGSDDGADWKPLVGERLIFDYSRYMDVSNREIRLPKNSYRWLKVSIAGIIDAKESPFVELNRKFRSGNEAERSEKTVLERRPFRIDRIELWHDTTEKLSENERKIDYRVVKWRVEEDTSDKATIIFVTMRSEPLTELVLATSSRNFHRSAAVQVPVKRGVRTEWIEIGCDRLSLLDFGGYRKESLGVFFPERRESEYRIVVHNQDSPSLTVQGVTAQGNVYRAVFLAAADQNYRLCYGSDESEPPRYDIAAVLTPLRQKSTVGEGRLGQQVGNAAASVHHFTFHAILINPIFLGVVVVGLVALLGLALFRAARRINEIPME